MFVIDASRSMGKRDVLVKGGVEKQRRVDAVLDACFEFIEVRQRTFNLDSIYISRV